MEAVTLIEGELEELALETAVQDGELELGVVFYVTFVEQDFHNGVGTYVVETVLVLIKKFVELSQEL